MKRIVIPAFIALLFAACTTRVTSTPTPVPTLAPRAIRVENPITPPDVQMVNQDGQSAKLSDFRGEHTLVFFSNIACEENCVDGLADFAQIRQIIGPRDDVTYVMVGTDIAADAPDKLKAYLAQADGEVIGLTAERAAMRDLAGKFGIHTYERRDGALAPHAPFVYLLDPDGRLIYFFQDGLSPADMAAVLQALIS
jgi:cytochrome oxidase Cu insertion factor (SCO1/SenC/PrrC family)